ncbi:putative thiolase (plasmid) [Rhizobium johnstonii 3841]|uniref:Thiolase n=1 Tax=Rhizobium johnstonii (strain DSM 114642 / LMG 32736 / 3841) TaxID=216596 RepID=Q1M689_RHIJ3|nr:acetyl-CoA acetyltransferase [Rhizobium leguminosarum]CAK03247.1 putative thiolase [Rhizobium johnstonii 3841]
MSFSHTEEPFVADQRRYVQSAVAALDDELGRSSVSAAEQSAVIAPRKYSRRRRFDAGDRRERRRGLSVSREDQYAFAVRSQAKAAVAQASGRLAKEITSVTIPRRKGAPVVVDKDEHPRATTMEAPSATGRSARPMKTITHFQ